MGTVVCFSSDVVAQLEVQGSEMEKYLLLLALTAYVSVNVQSQQVSGSGTCNEMENWINEARRKAGTPALFCDGGMRSIARSHVRDAESGAKRGILHSNTQFFPMPSHPGKKCSLHSWLVTHACCHYVTGPNDDVTTAEVDSCMWDKPKEILGRATNDRKGFEISHASGDPRKAFEWLRNSPGHNAVIMGQAPWSNMKVVGCYWRNTGENPVTHCWFSDKKKKSLCSKSSCFGGLGR